MRKLAPPPGGFKSIGFLQITLPWELPCLLNSLGSVLEHPGATPIASAAILTAPAAILTAPAATLKVPAAILTAPAAILTAPAATLTAPAATLTVPAATVIQVLQGFC